MKFTLRRYKELGKSLFWGAIAGVFLAIVFSSGFFLRELLDLSPMIAQSSGTDRSNSYPLLEEVQTLLNRHYLREQPDHTIREYAAIRGMLSSLNDRNTFFIDPPVARSESDVLAGTYGGIGVSLQRDVHGSYLLYPFSDSPSERAGIEDGDVLVRVNSNLITLEDHPDSVDQMLRGEVRDDNGVELTIRKGDGTEIDLFIPFEVINVPSVMWRVLAEDPRLGYLQIVRFTSRTPEEVDFAAEALRESGVDAVIVDLRDNSGGLLREAISVASVFLDGGTILVERRQDTETTYTAESGGSLLDLPIVVLINRTTASAAELVAGAIQDRQRAILIGQNTFGKGTIQQIFSLSDSSSVHITSAEWLTAEGSELDGVGLQPDLEIPLDAEGKDVEIVEAIQYLQNELETIFDESEAQ